MKTSQRHVFSSCLAVGRVRTAAGLLAPALLGAMVWAPVSQAAEPPKPAATQAGKTADDAKSVAAKPADAKESWKSLFDGRTLAGWESAKFGGEGKVAVENGAIVMQRGDMMTGIKSVDKPLKMNYELSLEGKRVEGNDFFCTTTFPVGDSFCSFVVGGWGGSVIGLSCIDFNDAYNNATMRTVNFKKDQWYAIRIRVTKEKIECWIDKEKVVDVTTRGHKLSTRFECDACKPLGVATWSTKGAIRNIRLRGVTEPDSKPDPEDEP
jgi:hypothetical protein